MHTHPHLVLPPKQSGDDKSPSLSFFLFDVAELHWAAFLRRLCTSDCKSWIKGASLMSLVSLVCLLWKKGLPYFSLWQLFFVSSPFNKWAHHKLQFLSTASYFRSWSYRVNFRISSWNQVAFVWWELIRLWQRFLNRYCFLPALDKPVSNRC